MTRLALAALLALAAGSAQAAEPQTSMTAYVNDNMRALFQDAAIQAAIAASNAAHAGLTDADIVALDDRWRAEIGTGAAPTVDSVVNSGVSELLRGFVDQAGGTVTEIILMDNRGMNVGVSSVTSDYWQGDEDKYQQTFQVGPDAVHVSEVEFDDSSQTYQAQVSFTITDPASGEAVGAATVGLNAEAF